MKHNKKRNTAFIYEALSREITKSIIEQDEEKKELVFSIIKEHFSAGTVLKNELRLYKTLLETKNTQEKVAERLLQETKYAYSKIDSGEIFDAQSKIIAAINKNVGQHTWSNFVPNFKTIASVNAIFNPKTEIKKKVLFEQAIVNRMSDRENLQKASELEPIDSLTYNSFIKKFNNKYENLLSEQKDLLNQYITSFSDEGFELRLYLNEELGRLKEALQEEAQKTDEALVSQKIENILEYLEEFRKREFDPSDLNKILQTQELIQEFKQP
jgi:hypothetical protein